MIYKSINKKLISLFLLLFTLGGQGSLSQEKLVISAIPDQYPQKLNRLYTILADELGEELGTEVEYKPVINYQAAVSAFRAGSLDLVWFGGLTGVQARLQKPGSVVLAQRDIDTKFHSVFITNKNTGIKPINNIEGLSVLKGKRFTFGSESSTSGRLMPQYFLEQAKVEISDFKWGRPGFSGSHDKTIALVSSGSYEVGVLNEQVWKDNLKSGNIDTAKVVVIWKTPAYVDYHWLAQPDLDERFGRHFTQKLQEKIISLNKSKPRQKQILELFGANKFIKAYNYQYKDIETIGRKLGKIR